MNYTKKNYYEGIERAVIVIFALLMSVYSFAQLTINNTSNTVNQLVNGVLVPVSSGTVVSNISFGGVYNVSSRYQIGQFSTATTTATQMGFSSGVILTTGNTSEVPMTLGIDPRTTQYTRNFVSCTAGEIRKGGTCPSVVNDLNVLAGGGTYYNTGVLEFDFVAVAGNVSFRYIFGSEEYRDNSGLINYQCSDYSDRFGFLLSGPGVSGGQGYTNDAKNIARLSNGSIVSINSVNNGVVGSSGGGPSAAKCLAANAAWVNGSPTANYLGTIDGTQMNGNTRILTAYQNGLTPGQTYHIKMVIMDLSDGAYESVVYLEASSFTTDVILLPIELKSFSGQCVKSKGVDLTWVTASERSNDYFLVERANNNTTDFEIIDTIQGIGTSMNQKEYSYTDINAPFGTNYYRLVQVDLDGRKEQLRTIVVETTCLIQNPYNIVTGFNSAANEITLSYDLELNKEMLMSVYSVSGEVIMQRNITLDAEENTANFTIADELSRGMYFVSLTNKESTIVTKIVK